MPDRTVNPLPDQRVERGTDGQRQVMAKSEIGQAQAHDRIDRPGMNPPVKKGQDHRLLGRRHRLGVSRGRRDVMGQRFSDREEHQANAHACGKQHREPAQKPVFGL